MSVFLTPLLTTAQRLALTNIPAGSTVFDTDLQRVLITNNGGVTPIWESFTLPTVTVNTTPFQMESNTSYFTALSSPQCNVIMPISPAVGDVVRVYSIGAAGFRISKGTAAVLKIDNVSITSYVESVALNDFVEFICYSAVSGGQWMSTGQSNVLLIDGVTRVPRLVAQSLEASSGNVLINTNTPIANQLLVATSPTNAQWEFFKFPTETVITATFQMENNVAYLTSLSSPQCVVTMPITPAVGDVVHVYNIGAAGFRILKGTATTLKIDNVSIASYVESQALNDFVGFICFSAAGGGHWMSTGQSNMLLIDSTTQVPQLVAQKLGTTSSTVLINTNAPLVNQLLIATSSTNAQWTLPVNYTYLQADRFGEADIILDDTESTFILATNVRFDSDSAYNPVTGIYTIPATGIYEINYGFTSTATGTITENNFTIDTEIYLNGAPANFDYVSQQQMLITGATGSVQNSSNVLMSLVAGDLISVLATNNGDIKLNVEMGTLTIKHIAKL